MSRVQGCNSLYFSVFEFWMSNHHINCKRKGWIKENVPVKGFLYALAVAGGWVGELMVLRGRRGQIRACSHVSVNKTGSFCCAVEGTQ